MHAAGATLHELHRDLVGQLDCCGSQRFGTSPIVPFAEPGLSNDVVRSDELSAGDVDGSDLRIGEHADRPALVLRPWPEIARSGHDDVGEIGPDQLRVPVRPPVIGNDAKPGLV